MERRNTQTSESDEEVQPAKKARTDNGKESLRRLLKESCEGQMVLSRYEEGQTLNERSRNAFANIVVRHEFAANPNKVIDTARFKYLAEKITELFPNEVKETFFIPAQTVGPLRQTILAKGKLWNQFTSFSRELRSCSLRELRPVEEAICIIENCVKLPDIDTGSANIEELLEFLRTHLEPWSLIVENWRLTCPTRLNSLYRDLKYERIADYVSEFPVLKQPLGFKLIESDFDALFPEAATRMRSHWSSFKQKVLFELWDNGYRGIESDAEVLTAFCGLLPSVPLKVPKGKTWKASKQDMKEGFLLHIKRIQDFENTIQFIESKYLSKGLTVQGFPMVVGANLKNIESSYFVIDRTPYLLESPTRAVEITFKAYHALHSQYPTVSCRFWILLQETLFGIVTASDQYVELRTQPELIRLSKTFRV